MKHCPKCGQSYSDPGLNFCLNDGELLMERSTAYQPPQFESPTRYADDPPPTVLMNDPRSTNPTGWSPSSQPPAQWQGQQIVTPPGHSPVQFANYTTPNQTLGIISTIVGAASITVGWCCYMGVLLGPAAIITGIVALVQNKNDPMRYGGKGFAIAGIVMGALYLVLLILFILLYGLAAIGGALTG